MLRFIQLDTNSYYTTITLNITGDYFTKKTYCKAHDARNILRSKYPYIKWQLIFDYLRRCCLSSVTDKTFTGLDYIYMSNTAGVLYKTGKPESTPGLLVGSVLFIFIVFYVFLLCVFTVWVPYCDVRNDFGIQPIFGSMLPPVFCRRAHVLLTLFVLVCAQWCPTNMMLCFLFDFSLCCILCTQCCRFFWIVHFWLPLRFSLTFIF